MDDRLLEDDTADERGKQQAARLQSLLSKLVRPPDEHPLPDLELSVREVRLMLALGERGEMIMTDLAGVIRAPLSTVTRMVDRLEAKGLTERFRSEEDRRIVLVRMAAKGRELHAIFERHHQELAQRMLAPLTPGEREILLELMAKMVAATAAGGI